MRSRTNVPLVALVAMLGGACTAGAAEPSIASVPATNAPASEPSGESAQPTRRADAWLVVGHAGEVGLEVIRADTGERLVELPAVVANDRWSLLVAATPGRHSTQVRVLDALAAWSGSEIVVDGAWRLPTIGDDPVPVGGSVDGGTLVLVEDDLAHRDDRRSTRFAVLRLPLGEEPRIIALDGQFEFDAISPDGSRLYVIEHPEGDGSGRYQVRSVDVATGTLDEGVIADKRTLQQEMAGWPIGQVRRDDGLVLTLYDGADHPFIHALDTTEGTAVCIDLPHGHGRDARTTLDWGLTGSGRLLYAVNTSLGHVMEIDGTTLEVRRSAEIEPLRSAAISLAKFGHSASGPVNRRAVATPEGRTVLAAGRGGVAAIDTAELRLTDRYLAGQAVEAVGLTPDGAVLYVLLRDRGRIVALDAATGNPIGEVPGEGYDRLLAVVPG